jgi:hypothetical protein
VCRLGEREKKKGEILVFTTTDGVLEEDGKV